MYVISTNVLTDGANTIHSWSPKGFPVVYTVEKLAEVEGPSYLSDENGAY